MRDSKHNSVTVEIDEMNKKISKITNIDITKIKMNKTDISNIEKMMKDKIDALSINITKEICEQITKSQKSVHQKPVRSTVPQSSPVEERELDQIPQYSASRLTSR